MFFLCCSHYYVPSVMSGTEQVINKYWWDAWMDRWMDGWIADAFVIKLSSFQSSRIVSGTSVNTYAQKAVI